MSDVGPSPADEVRREHAYRLRQKEAESRTQANLEALQSVYEALDLDTINQMVADVESGVNMPVQPTGLRTLTEFVDDLANSRAVDYTPRTKPADYLADIITDNSDTDEEDRLYNTANLLASTYSRAVFEVLMVTHPPADDQERQEARELSAKIAGLEREALAELLDSVERSDEDEKRLPDWQTATAAALQADRHDIEKNRNLRLVTAAAAEMRQTKAQLANSYIKNFGLIVNVEEDSEQRSLAQKVESEAVPKTWRKLIGGLGTTAVLAGVATSGSLEKLFYGGAMLTEAAALVGAQVLAHDAIQDLGYKTAAERQRRQAAYANSRLRETMGGANSNLIEHEGSLMYDIGRQLASAPMGKNFLEVLFPDSTDDFETPPADNLQKSEDEKKEEIKRRARIRSVVAAGALLVTGLVASIDANHVKDDTPAQPGKAPVKAVVPTGPAPKINPEQACEGLGLETAPTNFPLEDAVIVPHPDDPAKKVVCLPPEK